MIFNYRENTLEVYFFTKTLDRLESFYNRSSHFMKVILIFAATVFVVCFWLFLMNISNLSSKGASSTIAALKQQVKLIEDNLLALKKKPVVGKDQQLNQEIKNEENKLLDLGKKIKNYTESSTSQQKVITDMRGIIGHVKDLQLVALDMEKKKELLDLTSYAIYEYPITIKILGDYSSVLNYLSAVEKKYNNLFWRQLSYKVTKYPEASVEISINLLSVITKKAIENAATNTEVAKQ